MGGKSVPQNFLPEIALLFCILRFRRPDPQGREIAECWFFRPFWPRAAPWRSEKIRAENRKMQFPGARGILPKSAQFFYVLCFGRTDPQGREIAKYRGFRHFWPRAALGTWRNSGANKEKTQTALLRPKREKQTPFSSVLIPSPGIGCRV